MHGSGVGDGGVSGGGRPDDRRGGKSYCGGSNSDSKLSSLNLSTSTFKPKVNISGMSDRQAYIQHKKVLDRSPHADASGSLHVYQL